MFAARVLKLQTTRVSKFMKSVKGSTRIKRVKAVKLMLAWFHSRARILFGG